MVSSLDESEILCFILPSFIELAIFFVGDSNVAKAARDKLGDAEAFHANLYTELSRLDKALNLVNHDKLKKEPLNSAVTKVLGQFERRIHLDSQQKIKTDYSYPKLRLLKASQGSFMLSAEHDPSTGLRDIIRMTPHKPATRDRLIKSLTKFNQLLEHLIQQEGKHKIIGNRHHGKISPTTKPYTAFFTREPLNSLYTLITDLHKNCDCPSREMVLRLDTYRSVVDEMNVDIIFATMAQMQRVWQESDIRIVMESRKDEKAPVENPIIGGSKRRCSSNTSSEKVYDLCSLLQKSARLPGTMRLQLRKKHKSLWREHPAAPDGSGSPEDMMSLLQLLTDPFYLKTRKERWILSVILANSLLHLLDGPWLPTELSVRDIYFSRMQSGFIDITRPQIKGQPSSEVGNDIQDLDKLYPYPGILALGMLLLQIELRKPLEPVGNNPAISHSLYSSFSLCSFVSSAQQMLEECEYDSGVDFVNAIRLCLRPDGFPRNHSFDEVDFRHYVWEKVIMQLEERLFNEWKIRAEELKTSLLNDMASKLSMRIKDSWKPDEIESNHGAHPQRQCIQTIIDNEYCLFEADDGNYVQKEATTDECQRADKWFIELNNMVHPFIQVESNAHGEPPNCKPNTEVRVAILDTGLDLNETYRGLYSGRIFYRSWLDFDKDDEQQRNFGTCFSAGDCDEAGHGTHAGSLILKVAPNVKLYVARVFRAKNEVKTTREQDIVNKRIVEAIQWAVDEKVDIITMSFGYRDEVPIINQAINYALNNNVLIFAAASNNAGDRQISWPARREGVICIHATIPGGNHWDLTPNAEERCNNFGIIGHNVKSHWPPHLSESGHSFQRKSGTSTATPIAAGVAAIVLGYARHCIRARDITDEDSRILAKLKTMTGMSNVFLRMVKGKRGPYDYVVPWNFFKMDRDFSSHFCYLLRNEILQKAP